MAELRAWRTFWRRVWDLDRWALRRRRLDPENPVVQDAVARIQWYLDACRVKQVTELPPEVQADLVRELRGVLASPELYRLAGSPGGIQTRSP